MIQRSTLAAIRNAKPIEAPRPKTLAEDWSNWQAPVVKTIPAARRVTDAPRSHEELHD